MTQTPIPRRARCDACLRAASACICRFACPVVSKSALLILQHPLEVHNAKNSARLLHLCLPGSVVAVGETFDPDDLSTLLHGDGRTPLLLYPDTPADASLGLVTPPPLDAGLLARPDTVRLVVLDGTWRKSRKMLYANPLLRALPRLGLGDVPPSAYRIRKAHAPHQLSSFEAAALALARLEGDPAFCTPLLNVFDGFVQQQANFSPRLNQL